MVKRIAALAMVIFLLSFFTSGCYYSKATKEMKAAEKSFSDLKAQGGEKLVPYEYCSAEKFLEISKMEANESDWKHARDFADRSKAASEAGLAQVQKKK